jgi:hypothetical protein
VTVAGEAATWYLKGTTEFKSQAKGQSCNTLPKAYK